MASERKHERVHIAWVHRGGRRRGAGIHRFASRGAPGKRTSRGWLARDRGRNDQRVRVSRSKQNSQDSKLHVSNPASHRAWDIRVAISEWKIIQVVIEKSHKKLIEHRLFQKYQ